MQGRGRLRGPLLPDKVLRAPRGDSITLTFARATIVVGLLMFSGMVGCGNSGPARVLPDLPDASAPKTAIELYDTNHDGFLDAKELEAVPGLKAALKQVDTDKDGKISEAEIAGRIQFWADSHTARMPASCRVMHKGVPLAGAKVVFKPEKFLGGAIQTGSGTTTREGYAMINSPCAADPAVDGMSPGFYRVEITKDGEKVPARYNTETTLGTEVCNGIPHENTFELQY
jgi:hypothetical protein